MADDIRLLKLIAIHLGAGKCRNEEESKKIAKSICEKVMLDNIKPTNKYQKEQQDGPTNPDLCAVNAVVELVKHLEDHQALNCGYGSNLNILGQVECDASLMSDQTQLWVGIGAISGCRNPIALAKSLYDFQTFPRPLNLIQPNLLVGAGAKQWMREHCPYLFVVDSKLISSKSLSVYQKLKSKYDAAVRQKTQEAKCNNTSLPFNNSSNNNDTPRYHSQNTPDSGLNPSTNLDDGFYCMNTGERMKRVASFACASSRARDCGKQNGLEQEILTDQVQHSGKNEILCDARLDTVGAIAVDSNNNFASAISSGGLLLKCKGRVGQAAVPGAGCWAEDSVAVTTTGLGEILTLNLFAKKFYDKVHTLRLLHDLGNIERKQDLSNLITCSIEECFCDLAKSSSLAHICPQDRSAGMLAVSTLNSHKMPKRVDSDDLYLSFGHNTKSLCIGYMTSQDTEAKSIISSRIGGNENKALIQTIKFSFNQNKNSGKVDGSDKYTQST